MQPKSLPADGTQVHEVAITAPRACVLLILSAGGFAEVSDRRKFTQDGTASIVSSHQALQSPSLQHCCPQLKARDIFWDQKDSPLIYSASRATTEFGGEGVFRPSSSTVSSPLSC